MGSEGSLKRTVLVIDDDDEIRSIVAASLGATAGWRVIEAYCGAQGIERASQSQPDAILLDMMLPAMNGAQILCKLKTSYSTAHIPVVVLTGLEECAQSASRYPVAAVLRKPFNPRILAEEIAAALGWDETGPSHCDA